VSGVLLRDLLLGCGAVCGAGRGRGGKHFTEKKRITFSGGLRSLLWKRDRRRDTAVVGAVFFSLCASTTFSSPNFFSRRADFFLNASKKSGEHCDTRSRGFVLRVRLILPTFLCGCTDTGLAQPTRGELTEGGLQPWV
jgi:hypothetical protein